jgi:hypothetical protein
MTTSDIPFSFARSGIKLVDLPWEKRYFNPGKTPFPQGAGRYDDEGIAGAAREGRVMDHPVVSAGILLTRLDAYVVSGDQVYLDLAIRHAEQAALAAYTSGDAIYFPYPFDWDLHSFVEFPMEVPWFSGMAQGYMLSAYSRLYDVTRDERYLDYATRTFNSFLRPKGDDPYWTVDLEGGEYLWFEEYARNDGPSDRAFNGHIYATWGLHDYWMLTRDERAVALVDGGLTSILHFLDKWRFPGGQSFYCLTHRERTATYHGVHAGQLAYVFDITGAPVFVQLADLFIDDYPILITNGAANPTIHVESGTYSLPLAEGLTEEQRVELTFDEPVDLPWDVRGVMRGERVASVRCPEDPYRHIWFSEIPGKIWTAGKVDSLAWYQPLGLTPSESWDGTLWSYHEATDRLTPVDESIEFEVPLIASGRAKLNGRHCYQITGGAADGLWIARDDVRIEGAM